MKLAFEAGMQIFELTKRFPREETHSLTDQIRCSSRSVCSNIAEAWRKRRYEAAFVCKLNDTESEAAETQTWLRFASECAYLAPEIAQELAQTYNHVIGKLVNMINRSLAKNPFSLIRQGRRPTKAAFLGENPYSQAQKTGFLGLFPHTIKFARVQMINNPKPWLLVSRKNVR